MPDITVEAIVLKRRDSGESDRRLTVLSKELGKIDLIAKGARKAASRLAGSSDPLSVSRMTFAQGKRNQYVTQAQPIAAFRGLRNDYERLTMALALTELYSAVLPWEEPAPDAFDLLWSSLKALEVHPKPIVALVWAQVRLLEESGFSPQFGRCVVTDQPIAEASPYVSPSAGGYIRDSEAKEFSDRFPVRAEVLYGLSRLPELDQPPANLKFAEEALIALLPFWRSIADMLLPANDAVVAEVRHAQ